MTKLFTKTLIATALMSVAGVASAANVVSTPISVSKQFSGLTINAPAVTLTSANATSIYSAGVDVVFTYTGGEIAVAPAKLVGQVVNAAGAVVGTLDLNGTTAGFGDYSFDRVAQTANTVTYRLSGAGVIPTGALAEANVNAAGDTAVIAAIATNRIAFKLDGVQFVASSVVASSGINVSVAVKNAGGVAVDPVDTATGSSLSREAFILANQFAFKFNGETTTTAGDVISKTIDLASNRKKFVVATTGVPADAYTFSTKFISSEAIPKNAAGTDVAFDNNYKATVSTGTYVISGDFSWLKDSDATVDGIQLVKDTVKITPTASTISDVKYFADRIEFKASAVDTFTIAFDTRQGATGESALTLNNTSFSISYSQGYSNTVGGAATADVATNKSAGSFGSNGTTAFVYYMPFDTAANISQILYATETRGVDKANIKATVRDEKGTLLLSSAVIAQTSARGVTQLSTGLKDALAAKGFTTGKVQITIEADAPGVQVFSAYNVNGDRLATK